MRRLLAAIAAAGLMAGCGTPSADLFVVHRSGSIPGAALTMQVIDGGEVVCNGRHHEMSSDLLIDSRTLVRDLEEAAQASTTLPPGPGAILRYRIRTEDGNVAFSDTSRRQPPAFYRAALLVRRLAKGPCGLPR